ncbi:hypothetical protein [Rudanella lutea]|uniref:hypothetical protein n=1 Tax=Rudanella lutea TaxID=451374 RepID=UPI00035DE369|nr:hypothetical protein [Rudanella lutea]
MIRSTLFLLFVTLFVSPVLAQTPQAPQTYTYLIYHKLAPGMTIQDALPVEREWRAINQAAVDEGKLIGWHMMVKQMSSNPNPTEYDYVTCIVSPEMGIKGASPAAMAKIYGDSVQTRMASLQKRDRQTAPVVKIEVWENLSPLFGAGFRPDKQLNVVVDFLKLRDAQTDWRPSVTALTRTGTDLTGQKQLAGWGLSALVVPNAAEKGYNFAQVRAATSLGILARVADAKQLENSRQLNRTFEVVRQEVFRFEEFTLRPSVSK